MWRRVGAVLLVDASALLLVDRKRVELIAVVVRDRALAVAMIRLEHAEAERGERVALDASVLRARDDVVPRRRQDGSMRFF